MRIAYWSLSLLLGGGIAQADDHVGHDQFGLVAVKNGVGCIATNHRIKRFPQPLRIIVPDDKGMVAVRGQAVSALREACPELVVSDQGSRYYAIRMGSASDEGKFHGVADFGNQPLADFRYCASTEGIHFTVWTDAAMRGKRLWHGYAYLGYDVEPSCTEKEESE